MSTDLLASLQRHFGFTAFRPGQAEALGHVLAGRHTLVVMPTGTGKSLVFQLAALHRPGVTLVVSPLIALMQDQVDHLTRVGIPATAINSLVPTGEQERRLRGMADGTYRLVYIAPERLRHAAFQYALTRARVGLLAVDEAHCVSQWGHDFRPDYLHIATARAQMGAPPTVALTATATPQAQDDIVRLLGLPGAERIVTGFNRPNLALAVRSTPGIRDKLASLRDLLLSVPDGAVIIYAGVRRDAEEVADFVREVVGRPAEPYHAGLDGDTRARVQDAFLSGRLNTVVATNAFGMGVDRPDVRLVVHYSLPSALEAYYQEAGRAGRDSAPARAVLLYAPKDRALQEWFIEQDAPAEGDISAVYRILTAKEMPEVWVTVEGLSRQIGLSEVKVRLTLAHLETMGAVLRVGDDGPEMLLQLGDWNDQALGRQLVALRERQRRKLAQLGLMVRYAEANDCRRQIILRHFGDLGPPDALVCCDNCEGRQALVQAESTDVAALPPGQRAALVVLDAVRRMKWDVGKSKLTKILHGSRAQDVQLPVYIQHIYYGKLAALRRRDIEALIDELMGLGYLKSVGAEQPTLRLTPQGRAALTAHAAIPVTVLADLTPDAIARKREVVDAGGTIELTLKLFRAGETPEAIAQHRDLAPDTIYNHLARAIADETLPLDAVLPADIVDAVQAAIQQVGSVAALSPIKARLPDRILFGQIRCVVENWKRAQGGPPPSGAFPPLSPSSPPAVPSAQSTSIDQFLARAHPRPLAGPWQAGWALDFHSRFAGADWSRSPTGELAYRLKYAGDRDALQPLVDQINTLCEQQPELRQIDIIAPIPSTTSRPFEPVKALAEALSHAWNVPTWPALVKTRATEPQKAMTSLAQKRANVAGAFAARGPLRGQRVLLIDDLYDSGATLDEAARTLRGAGAAAVLVLALTRTIHTDG